MTGGGKRSSANPRYAHRTRREALRARLKAEGNPCHICGKPIDYSLPAGHPMSYELDEIVPVALGGDPLDAGNVQPAHRICNERKGAKAHLNRSAKSKAAHTSASGLPFSRDW